jgi:hypothetical protein
MRDIFVENEKHETLVFGDYDENPSQKVVISNCSVILSSDELIKNWKKCSLTSDFFADFYGLYFPEEVSAENPISRNDIKNSVSFILNELIENAAKYSNTDEKTVIFRMWYLKDYFIVNIENYISEDSINNFIKIIKEILSGDTEELYIQKLELNAETDSDGSGMGYLTLMNDYGVKFGYRFERINKNSVYKSIIQAHINFEGDK